MSAAPKIDRRRSFIRLVCPFLFDPHSDNAPMDRADRAEWVSKETAHPVWARVDHRSLLPDSERYLRDLSGAARSAAPSLPSQMGLWKLDNNFITSSAGLASSRLTRIALGKGRGWVKLEAVDLVLFGSGVGFVVFEYAAAQPPRGMPPEDCARPEEPATWLDCAKYVRRISQPIFTRVTRGDEKELSAHRLVALLLGTIGLDSATEVDDPTVDSSLISAAPITFTSLFIDGATEEQAREWIVQLRYGLGSAPADPPSPEQLALEDSGVQRRSSRSWFFGSSSSAGFVGVDLPKRGFWEHFPGELRRQYQLGLLIVLQQRHALLRVGELISSVWLNDEDSWRIERFNDLQQRLHYLAAHLMPQQFSQRNSQQRFYRTMRRVFAIEPLHEDVRRTVTELSDSLRLRMTERQGEQQARFERVVSAFALLFGVPSLVLAFLAIDVSGISKPLPLVVAVLLLFASFGLGALIGFMARRRRRLSGA